MHACWPSRPPSAKEASKPGASSTHTNEGCDKTGRWGPHRRDAEAYTPIQQATDRRERSGKMRLTRYCPGQARAKKPGSKCPGASGQRR